MRRLLPTVTGLRLEDAYGGLVLPAPPEGGTRATVALGMVSSLDGAVTVDGGSAGLGGPADRVAFRQLRAACDAILVGAGTARAEDYGPPRAPAARVARRVAAGLAPAPRLVVVTDSARLDPTARLFTAPRDEGVAAPVVVCHDGADPRRRERLADVAEVVVHEGGRVDLARLLGWCRDRGLDRVLCEGGPRLNGALLAADLVDEVFVTVAPQLVAGDAGRIVAGPSLRPTLPLELVELHEHEGELLLRYRIGRSGRSPAGGDDVATVRARSSEEESR